MTDQKKRAIHEKTVKNIVVPQDYTSVLDQIKNDVQQSQLRAAQSVTKELIILYWRIGKTLAVRVADEGWGAKTIEWLSRDLHAILPEMSGFSFRNLKYMRQFAEIYTDVNWAATVAQIPWGHNIVLMDKVATLV